MAEKITVTLRQVIDLRRALNSLDAAKSGVNGDIVPFEFDTKTRYRLMKNAVIAERDGLVYDKLERAVALEAGVYEGMEQTDANGRKLDVFKRKIEEVKEQTVEMDGVLFIKLCDLLTRPLPSDAKPTDKPKSNPVPQSVLAKLSVIIEEEAP